MAMKLHGFLGVPRTYILQHSPRRLRRREDADNAKFCTTNSELKTVNLPHALN